MSNVLNLPSAGLLSYTLLYNKILSKNLFAETPELLDRFAVVHPDSIHTSTIKLHKEFSKRVFDPAPVKLTSKSKNRILISSHPGFSVLSCMEKITSVGSELLRNYPGNFLEQHISNLDELVQGANTVHTLFYTFLNTSTERVIDNRLRSNNSTNVFWYLDRIQCHSLDSAQHLDRLLDRYIVIGRKLQELAEQKEEIQQDLQRIVQFQEQAASLYEAYIQESAGLYSTCGSCEFKMTCTRLRNHLASSTAAPQTTSDDVIDEAAVEDESSLSVNEQLQAHVDRYMQRRAG